MFQYMFFYWLQQQTDDACVLDDLAFFGKICRITDMSLNVFSEFTLHE